MKAFVKKHKFKLAITAILLFAIFLRFYDYTDRWGLAYDQAHDALIAHYAVENGKLPLLGPFSSAGPFQTGGEWYWIVMFGTALYPPAILSPWIFVTSLYVIFVGLIMFVAYKIAGKQFALITGILAAISTAQLAQGVNLTNQSPQALVALISILCVVLYLKKQALRYLFFLGLSIGFGASIHLSGVGLLFVAISLFLVLRKFPLKGIGLLIIGGLIPWIPVFSVDVNNHFFNSKNMLQYYLHDQHTIPLEALGRRWLTYLGVFWPKEWSHIIGGFSVMGYVTFILLFVLFAFRINMKKIFIIMGLSVLFMIILLRYTHTPLFSSYLVFMHPLILLLTGWVVWSLFKVKKVLGVLIFAGIVCSTLYKDIQLIRTAENFSNIMAKDSIQGIEKKYDNKKFAVYTYKDKWKEKNYILALYLEKENKIDKAGLKVATVIATREAEFNYPILWGEKTGYQVIDLSSTSSAYLEKNGWKYVDGESTYVETEEWFK